MKSSKTSPLKFPDSLIHNWEWAFESVPMITSFLTFLEFGPLKFSNSSEWMNLLLMVKFDFLAKMSVAQSIRMPMECCYPRELCYLRKDSSSDLISVFNSHNFDSFWAKVPKPKIEILNIWIFCSAPPPLLLWNWVSLVKCWLSKGNGELFRWKWEVCPKTKKKSPGR